MKRERDKKEPKINRRQEQFCELVALGATPQEAHLGAGYSMKSVTSRPYLQLQKKEIIERVQQLMDKSLPTIVRNDVALAKIKVHKGQHLLPNGEQIPPSLIEGAKNRIYDRSALGPVVRQTRNENLNANIAIDLTPERVREVDTILEQHYVNKTKGKM